MSKLILPPGLRGLMAHEESRWGLVQAALDASGVPQANTYESGMTSRPDPFGVFVDADGRVVVDDFTSPISNIPAIVREFARDNQGYWIEDIFNSPGWTVQGGAVQYTISAPGSHFLPEGQLMPRAPGAEAPRIRGTRQRPVVAYPESIAGSIEVADEVRQRNQVWQVQQTFRQAANTFAETFQALGETALSGLVTLRNRVVFGGPGTFTDWANSPVVNSTSAMPYPGKEFARVRRLFVEERGGVQPDTIVWTPEDAERFYNIYGERGNAILTQHGFTRTLQTVRRTAGRRLYLRSGQVGTMAWEQPMGDPEYTREGTRKTDVYTMEGRVVFIANGADALLEVRDQVS
ncbi:MAG: hypothetical protein LC798_15635 [Chloroflexi bacterium]|nr:hypothetical protein [Chloroflexota bacterium]